MLCPELFPQYLIFVLSLARTNIADEHQLVKISGLSRFEVEVEL